MDSSLKSTCLIGDDPPNKSDVAGIDLCPELSPAAPVLCVELGAQGGVWIMCSRVQGCHHLAGLELYSGDGGLELRGEDIGNEYGRVPIVVGHLGHGDDKGCSHLQFPLHGGA